MKFTSTAVVVAALSLSSAAVHAQEATVQGAGYQVGEGTVVHPSIGAETGFVSNVFYEDESSIAAGLLRILGKLAIEPMEDRSNKGGAPADVDFSAGLRVEYQEYLTTNGSAQDQRNVGLGADLMLGLKPQSTFPISFEDHFIRVNRPTNFESNSTLSRDINSFRAGVAYKPEGRNLSGRLNFKNTIDVFESSESAFANRLLNDIELGIDWQLLPITRFFIQGSYGFNTGLGSASTKVSSNPIRGTAGVATAVTESITLKAHGGYALGGYDGASYSDFIYHVEGGFRYSPVGRVRFIFDRDYKDSINANYYGEYMGKFVLDQQVSRVMLQANAAARLRSYAGVDPTLGGGTVRDDFILSVQARATLELREWLGLSASYELSSVATDYRTSEDGEIDDPSFIRHQAMVGATAAF